jgi:predicted nucleic acid-binding protein
MSDVVVDSSVIAKWFLSEADSADARRLGDEVAATGGQVIVLDLALIETANAIWKRQRRQLIDLSDAKRISAALMIAPVHIVAAHKLLPIGLEIAVRYDRPVYDALFVALSKELGLPGVTADEPLVNAVRRDFPQIMLLRERT